MNSQVVRSTFVLLAAGFTAVACSSSKSPATNPTPEASAATVSTVETASVTVSASHESTAPSIDDSEQWLEISVNGVRLLCQDAFTGFQQYDCHDAPDGEQPSVTVQPDLYCSGSLSLPDCSELWYPSELDRYGLVDFDGISYICEQFGEGCVEYAGGRPPNVFASPDVWCDNQRCTYFDPDRYFEITYDGQTYVCQRGGQYGHDCYQPIGNRLPIAQPDLYCSGSEFSPRCSGLWYPDDLDQYELIQSGGSTYLCERAIGGSFGDYDCGRYTGGNPSFLYTGELKCSDSLGSFECDTEFYPSELEGLSFVTIEFQDYVCKATFRGSECFQYFGGSPRSATLGLPDFYCSSFGQCSEEYYP